MRIWCVDSGERFAIVLGEPHGGSLTERAQVASRAMRFIRTPPLPRACSRMETTRAKSASGFFAASVRFDLLMFCLRS